MANANVHLQVYKKLNLNRGNKCKPTSGTTFPSDAIIGNISHNNMTLIPFVINPFGCLGPILPHLLFGTRPAFPIFFPPSQPHATEMYKHITMFLSSMGILQLADHNWTIHQPHLFFWPFILFPNPIHLHPSIPWTLYL